MKNLQPIFKWSLLGIFLLGLLLTVWLFFEQQYDKRRHDPQYDIIALLQSSEGKESLKTAFLAELLNLSLDLPTNIFQYDAKQGEKALQACPLIKKAHIDKILPATLYIQYEMRTPIAFIGDFHNAAIDDEGILIPFTPFYTPKNIPIFYLGSSMESLNWGDSIQDLPALCLAKNIYSALLKAHLPGVRIQAMDLVDAFSEQRGRRQVILRLYAKPSDILTSRQEQGFLLRWDPENYAQCLQNLLTLQTNKASLGAASTLTIIDQRLPQLAFIRREG